MPPANRCANCRSPRGHHQLRTLRCPTGHARRGRPTYRSGAVYALAQPVAQPREPATEHAPESQPDPPTQPQRLTASFHTATDADIAELRSALAAKWRWGTRKGLASPGLVP